MRVAPQSMYIERLKNDRRSVITIEHPGQYRYRLADIFQEQEQTV